MTSYTDQELITLFKKGEKKEHIFNLIIDRYKKKLYMHIRKILISHEDTDDTLQNAFVKVWFALDNFREEAALHTWLYKIVTNEALTLLRKKKKHIFFPGDENKENLAEKLESDPYFNGDELQLELQKAILSLPEKQRLVFNMKYFDEMKYEDMSEILGTSVGALKSSYHHAVKKIEKFMVTD